MNEIHAIFSQCESNMLNHNENRSTSSARLFADGHKRVFSIELITLSLKQSQNYYGAFVYLTGVFIRVYQFVLFVIVFIV